MATDDDHTAPSPHAGEPANGDQLKERLIDYLMALSEAVNIPPAGPEDAYYALVRSRLLAVVASLKVTLGDGLARALPGQTARFRARIAKLPPITDQRTDKHWRFNPVRPGAQATGAQLQAPVTEFLRVLLEVLDVPASPDSHTHPWLLEDRVVAADIAMAMVRGSDLGQSLPAEVTALKDCLAELRTGRYPASV
jgi:hypothetical protein